MIWEQNYVRHIPILLLIEATIYKTIRWLKIIYWLWRYCTSRYIVKKDKTKFSHNTLLRIDWQYPQLKKKTEDDL